MCIAPYSPRESVAVTVGYVHAADESCFSVDNGDLTVIAVVEFIGELGK